MPNKSIDHSSVVWMAKTGFHVSCIAERLGCSRRQVDRILKANEVRTTPFLFDFSDEHLMWAYYKNWKESAAKIAKRFGVSRQAVHSYFKKLNELPEHDLSPVYRGFPYTTHSIERVPDAEFELIEH